VKAASGNLCGAPRYIYRALWGGRVRHIAASTLYGFVQCPTRVALDASGRPLQGVTFNEARRIAVHVAKLPELLGAKDEQQGLETGTDVAPVLRASIAGLLYSTDGGATWTDLSAGLPGLSVKTVTAEDSPLNGIYVGTDDGVYYRDDKLGNFVPQAWAAQRQGNVALNRSAQAQTFRGHVCAGGSGKPQLLAVRIARRGRPILHNNAGTKSASSAIGVVGARLEVIIT
jgi:hypothetical protein